MSDSTAPLPGHPPVRWTRADVFRATLFVLVLIAFTVLLWPLALVAAVLWLVLVLPSRSEGGQAGQATGNPS
jgi:hypothetical protein